MTRDGTSRILYTLREDVLKDILFSLTPTFYSFDNILFSQDIFAIGSPLLIHLGPHITQHRNMENPKFHTPALHHPVLVIPL